MAGSRKEGKTVAYHEAVASLAVASLAVASLAAASLAVASLAVLLCSSGLHWHSSYEIQVTSDWLSSIQYHLTVNLIPLDCQSIETLCIWTPIGRGNIILLLKGNMISGMSTNIEFPVSIGVQIHKVSSIFNSRRIIIIRMSSTTGQSLNQSDSNQVPL